MAFSDSDFDLFCKSKLFQGLDKEELKALYSISKEIYIHEGATLIHEGEKATEVFIINEGTLEVVKYDPDEKEAYVIDTLSAGDTVGEIAFIDKGFRSASVRTKTDAKLRSISFDALQEIVTKSPKFFDIYIHVSQNISQRLRNTSNIALKALKQEVKEARTRVRMGLFLINIIVLLCLFAYSLSSIKYLLSIVPNTTYIALPLTLVMGIFLLSIMKFSKLSWKEFGFNSSNWKQATFDGVVFSIPMIFVGIFYKWMLIQFDPHYHGHQIFEPFLAIQNPAEHTWGYWIGLNTIYWFIIVPIQELLTRGGLQGLLEYFLPGKHKILFSIVMSNLIFSTVHVFFPLQFSLFILIGGMYLGWIYSRTHNLISSSIAHAVLGTWAFSVIGGVITV